MILSFTKQVGTYFQLPNKRGSSFTVFPNFFHPPRGGKQIFTLISKKFHPPRLWIYVVKNEEGGFFSPPSTFIRYLRVFQSGEENGLRCRHNKHLALITEQSALLTIFSSGFRFRPLHPSQTEEKLTFNSHILLNVWMVSKLWTHFWHQGPALT